MKLHAFSSPDTGSKEIAAGPQLGEVRGARCARGTRRQRVRVAIGPRLFRRGQSYHKARQTCV